MNHRPHKRTTRKGFTLVEVLLAMALSMLLLTGAVAFLSNMSLLFVTERSNPQPYAHADHLLRFLEHTLASAEPSQNTGNSSSSSSSDPIRWQMLPDAPPGSDPLLSFNFSKPLPPLESSDIPTYERVCFLEFQSGEGLMLLWYPTLSDESPEEGLRRTLLSPHVTEMKYHYFNPQTERWETLDSFLDEGQSRPMPQIIELTVSVGDDKTRTLNLILPPSNNPSYPIY